MTTADFDKDLEWSISEGVKRKNYSILLQNFPVKKIDFTELEPQKNTNDVDISLMDGTSIKVELKNYKEGRIWSMVCLEVWNNKKVNPPTPGWTFKLEQSKTDYVLFTWHGKDKECYLILKGKELGRWWRENFKNYTEHMNKESTRNGATWQSSFASVPIKDLPKDLIKAQKAFQDLKDFW